MRAPSAVLFAVLVLVAAIGFPAEGQQTGDIAGTVTDASQGPLPGVTVEIRSPALQGTRSTTTDSAGRFRFPAVPPGAYTVTAALAGFTKAEKPAHVGLGTTATVPIAMGVAAEIVVTESLVDVTRGGSGNRVEADTIQRLPMQRNYGAAAGLVAGTGTDAGGVTVYGSTGLENQWIIDGVNTTGVKIGDQGKNLNTEFVQEVEVKTGGYEAEYSRALGGVINVVTKSGGNEFHGDVFGYYDSEGLASSDKRVDDRAAVGTGELVLPKRLDVGADLGGYFVKDRLWFFGAYDRVNRDQKNNLALSQDWETGALTTRQQTDTTRTNLFSGKLTFRLGESHTIAVSAFGDPGALNGELPNVAGIIGPTSAHNGENTFGGTDLSAKWDGVFGTQLLAQLQYGYHEDKTEDSPESTALAVAHRKSGVFTVYQPGSGNPLYFREHYRRNNTKGSASLFLGANEVKLGVDYEGLNSTFLEARGGGALVRDRFTGAANDYWYTRLDYFATVPLNCNSILDANGNVVRGSFGAPGPANAQVPSTQSCLGYTVAPSVENPPSTANLGLFLQDSFKVLKNLTVNAGLRYDEQRLKNASGESIIKLANEWSPRVGLVWDFLDNGRSKLFASYGRYYEVIPQDIQTRALGNEYGVTLFNYQQGVLDPVTDPGFAPYAYVQGGELNDPALKGMYQDELIAGVEYELFKNWSVGVKGIYKALGRVVEDRCDLVDPRVNLSGFIPAGALTTCALINPGDGGAVAQLKDPTNPACVAADGSLTGGCESVHARRYYRGLELDLTHRFASNFYLLASYVYSKLEGNYDGNLKQSSGQADPNINADFDYSDLMPNNFGRLVLDRRHQLKVSGTYSFPFGVTAGATYRFASGAPASVMGYANAFYPQERFLVARGSFGERPSTMEMDLHLEYTARLGSVTVTPIVDVFNLLDRQGATGYQELFNNVDAGSNDPAHQAGQPGCSAANAGYSNASCATVASYGMANAWQPPRQVRVGARVSF